MLKEEILQLLNLFLTVISTIKKNARYAKKSGIVFIYRILGMLLAYVTMLYITNQYGAEIFGRYSISLTLWQLATLLFSLGLPNAIVKLTADHRFFENGTPLNQYLNKSARILILSGAACSFILFFSKEWLASTVFKDIALIPYFRYMSVFIALGVFHLFLSEFLRGRKFFAKYALFYYVLPYAISIPLLYLFHTLKLHESNIILAYVLSICILAIILAFYYPKRLTPIGLPQSNKDLLRLSFPLLLSAAFIFISNWTDIFMLGIMASKSEVGIYNVAYKLASISLIVISAVNTVLAPKISELYSRNDISTISIEIKRSTWMITAATIPIFLILVIFSKEILSFFGDEFVQGQKLLIVVSVGLLFNALSGSVGQVMSMTSHQKELRNFTLISAATNILLNYFLIKSQGALGAALASVSSNVLLNVMCIVYVKRKFNFFTFIRL